MNYRTIRKQKNPKHLFITVQAERVVLCYRNISLSCENLRGTGEKVIKCVATPLCTGKNASFLSPALLRSHTEGFMSPIM